MNSVLLYDKSFLGKGKKLIKEFISGFQDNLSKNIFQYAKLSKNDGEIEHLFWYGEQQLKTAATTSLFKLCNGYIMQEPGVSRKVNKSGDSAADYKNGRVDYWCRIGKATKVSILVEMKHGWIKYYSPKKWTIYKYALDRHESAIKQLHDIEKSDFIVDHLYGVALTVLPMFIKYDSIDEKYLSLNQNTLNNICERALKNTNVHACGGFILPNVIQEITDWSDETRNIYESYPGLVYLWSIYKYTKK
jgi:hypothetical protein